MLAGGCRVQGFRNLDGSRNGEGVCEIGRIDGFVGQPKIMQLLFRLVPALELRPAQRSLNTRRARIQGSKSFVSLNSRRESTKEGRRIRDSRGDTRGPRWVRSAIQRALD